MPWLSQAPHGIHEEREAGSQWFVSLGCALGKSTICSRWLCVYTPLLQPVRRMQFGEGRNSCCDYVREPRELLPLWYGGSIVSNIVQQDMDMGGTATLADAS